MKILIIGTTGAIGSNSKRNAVGTHEVISAGRNSGDAHAKTGECLPEKCGRRSERTNYTRA